ncbi:MAG: RidA family protein [bacterium]|nr:RidA family protein [bacterium]
MKTIINTSNAPSAVGPYSQAVLAGDYLFISGQIGIDPAVGKITAFSVAEQAKQALNNVGAILEEAGLSFSHVVKATVLLNNINDFGAVNEVYASFFSSDFPARAAFQAANLPIGALVEIEVIAYVKES